MQVLHKAFCDSLYKLILSILLLRWIATRSFIVIIDCGHIPGMNFHVCRESHKRGIILTNSRVDAKKLEKLVRFLPQCECKDLIKSKGICVGWKNGNMKSMSDSIKDYLLQFWRNEGLFNDDTAEEFSSQLKQISYVIFNGVHYQVGITLLPEMMPKKGIYSYHWIVA